MANTININIKNCCCCGGGSGSTGSSEIVPIEDWPDPTGDEGPPEGYGEPSTLADRQCKTAIFLYWWLYYLIDNAVNTTVGNAALNFLASQSVPNIVKDLLAKWLLPLVSGALSSLITFGIEISDAVTFSVAFIITRLVFGTIADIFVTHPITIPLMEDALAKLPGGKDLIICKLSTVATPAEAYAELEKVLMEPSLDLSFTQRKVILAFMPGALLNLLFWSADWWPSFEDETLASITDTCCGNLENGLPLPAGTDEKCNAANFIVDQLIELFNNTGEFIDGYGPYWWNHILDIEGEIYDNIKTGLTIPTKLRETAYDINLYQRFLAKYMAAKFITFNPLNNLVYDTTFQGLTNHLIQNDTVLVCELYEAENVSAAYTFLHDEITDWLDANVTDQEQNSYLESAIQGIIHSQGDFMKLIFEQDTDLLGYTGIVDCSLCAADCSPYTYDFSSGLLGWVQQDCPDPLLAPFTRVSYTQEADGLKHTHQYPPIRTYAAIYKSAANILSDTGLSELKANQIKVTINYTESESFGYLVLLSTTSGNTVKHVDPGQHQGSVTLDFSNAPDEDVIEMYVYTREYYGATIWTTIHAVTILYGEGC